MTAATLQEDLATVVREVRQPACWKDPYPFYRQLRERDPLLTTADNKLVVTGHRLCRTILRDSTWEHFPELLCMSSQIFEPTSTVTAPHRPIRPEILDAIPERDNLRRRLAREFRPATVRPLLPTVQQIADELVDEVLQAGTVDLIGALVIPFTSTVMGESFGVPPMDRYLFRKWSSTLRGAAEATFVPAGAKAKTADVAATSREVGDYMRDLIAERRRVPQDDVLTALVSQPSNGTQWNDDEIVSSIVSIIVVGHHTTTASVGNGIVALLHHPDQLARLRDNPGIADRAAEELVRYDTPAQFISRYAMRDTSLDGREVKAGQIALMFIGAANRDPAAFAEPDSLDLTRSPNDHLGFSTGHAACFGAPLAQLAGQVLFSTLARRIPHLALDGDPVQFDTIGLRGIEALPVRTS